MRISFKARNKQEATVLPMVRVLSNEYEELAYFRVELTNVSAQLSFPSTWHERAQGRIYFAFFVFTFMLTFPWKWLAPDYHQCDGPRFGFSLSREYFHFFWGQDTGRSADPRKSYLWETPYRWKFKEKVQIGEPIQCPFRYVTQSGEVQETMATVQVWHSLWIRFWSLAKMNMRHLDVDFHREMGEKVGTWKGGVLQSHFQMEPGENVEQALARRATKSF